MIERIFAGRTGNERMSNLFRERQGKPISRDFVEAVAQQQDFMRRVRSDSGRGTRDHLAREGILLLSGHYDAPLIAALGLPICSGSDFVSYKLKDDNELAMAIEHGFVQVGPN